MQLIFYFFYYSFNISHFIKPALFLLHSMWCIVEEENSKIILSFTDWSMCISTLLHIVIPVMEDLQAEMQPNSGGMSNHHHGCIIKIYIKLSDSIKCVNCSSYLCVCSTQANLIYSGTIKLGLVPNMTLHSKNRHDQSKWLLKMFYLSPVHVFILFHIYYG